MVHGSEWPLCNSYSIEYMGMTDFDVTVWFVFET